MLDYLCQYKYITSLIVEAVSSLNLEQSNVRPHSWMMQHPLVHCIKPLPSHWLKMDVVMLRRRDVTGSTLITSPVPSLHHRM